MKPNEVYQVHVNRLVIDGRLAPAVWQAQLQHVLAQRLLAQAPSRASAIPHVVAQVVPAVAALYEGKVRNGAL